MSDPPATLHVNKLPAFLPGTPATSETIELVQACIRVDTTNPPGKEMALARLLKEKFDAEPVPFMRTGIIETAPGRGNVVVTLEGSDPANNPSLGLAAHLDVVPATEKSWIHPPFSGTLVDADHDAFIWGRGALDMKQTAAGYVVAVLALLREGFRPRGNVKLIFEADEERGGHEGMEVLVRDHWDAVQVDCLVTEGGGFKFPLRNDFIIQVGEKGKAQTRLVAKGLAGHGSVPDPYEKLAIYKIVEILTRIKARKPRLELGSEFKATVNALSLPGFLKILLKRKRLVRPLIALAAKLLKQDLAKVVIPMVTDTIAPTITRGGEKENVVSPEASVVLDIRTLPGHDRPFINTMLRDIVGKTLFDQLEIEPVDDMEATTTPPGTWFHERIATVFKEMCPGANIVPLLGVGSTDMRYFRQKNIPCYGFVPMLKDPDLTYGELASMSHAPNERISLTNLMLNVEFAYRLVSTF